MRKIIVFSMITLDGVMQAPGSPEEDKSGGFKYGGWTAPFTDKSMAKILKKELSEPFSLLLGSKTYKIFSSYWPNQTGYIADPFNRSKKYVVSEKDLDLTWDNTELIQGDVADRIKVLKAQVGPQFHVWGSSQLIQTLLENDLVDELRLRIYPITIGKGKKLFADGTIPMSFKLLDSQVLPSGVILANYQRAGAVETGTVGE